jgi:hypothetical protein
MTYGLTGLLDLLNFKGPQIAQVSLTYTSQSITLFSQYTIFSSNIGSEVNLGEARGNFAVGFLNPLNFTFP